MTINQLIACLEDYRDDLGGETEVRLMNQFEWPFEYNINNVVSTDDIRCATEDFEPEGDAESVVYITEGTQLGYGTKAAWT